MLSLISSKVPVAAAFFLAAFCCAAYAGDGPAMGFRPSPVDFSPGRPKAAKRTLRLGAKSADLPSKWDSRDHGWVSSVKNQGSVGACWSFSACAVIETQLLKAGRGEWNLSEKNMVNLHGFELGPDDGGDNYLALAYLLRWAGAVAETNDVYARTLSAWTPSPRLAPALRVQKVVWIPGRGGPADNDALKGAIREYGAVSTSIYWDFGRELGCNYYCGVSADCNHAIAVVGWDDGYAASNFRDTPDGNGAWLIKNSWGTGRGAGGYYWVSYFDANFAIDEGAVFIPAAAEDRYDAVYGYDVLGPMSVTSTSSMYTLEAAVFTSAWNEEIAAVGVFSNIDGNPYEISVYTNVERTASTESPNPLRGGALACSTSGTVERMGYSTIPLPNAVKVADGTSFAVVYEQKGTDRPHIFSRSMNFSDGTPYAVVNAEPGRTYWGYRFGASTNWIDLSTRSPGCVACLKAYTRSTVASDSGPSETDDGTAALEWLAATNATLFAETGETFGAFAGLVGANGRTLWTSWLAGFDPADAADGEFEVEISVTNGKPSLVWRPDLGSSARTYTIYGTESLSPQNWQPVSDLATTSAKFFKVSISTR
jgi:C1A family cysteine protease